MTAEPQIGVIVVAYNTKRYWPRLRAALEAQTYKAWRLVVVDNASESNERLVQSDLPEGAQLIQSKTNSGFAAANNLAARKLDTPYLALLNPDAFPEPAWLEELLAAVQRWPNAAAVGSLLLLADDPTRCDGDGDELHALGVPYRSRHRQKLKKPAPEGPCFSTCGAAALYRAEDFKLAGGFDELFFSYCEDVDLGYRLRLRGRISVQAPRAVVHHVSGGSAPRASSFADFHGRRNRVWVFVKNTPPTLFWPMLPVHLLASLMLLFVSSLTGRGTASWAGFCSAFDNLTELKARRRATQRTRTASTWSIASALTWSPFALIARSTKRH